MTTTLKFNKQYMVIQRSLITSSREAVISEKAKGFRFLFV